MTIFQFLETHGIPYEKFEHQAVFTTKEAKNLPPMAGADTKNLFLRDRDGARHFLVVIPHRKNADLKSLRALLHANKLSFGSPERLQEHLGVQPGSVTLLGLVHDTAQRVEVYIDAELWNAPALLCHPLVNTATLAIPHAGIVKFLELTVHEAHIIEVPGR